MLKLKLELMEMAMAMMILMMTAGNWNNSTPNFASTPTSHANREGLDE